MSVVPFRNESPASRTPSEPRPFLVQGEPGLEPPARSLLVWWHLLSLDAPTVAATWTAFLAWAAGLRISALDSLAMFLAVWILYAADRLLDARLLEVRPLQQHASPAGLEQRHRFHHRYRSRFVAAILVSILPFTWVLHHLNNAELHLDVLLASLLSAWLILVHARPAASSATAHRLPKELAVGVFFPAAVFLPTVARDPALRLALLLPALAFAAVCTLNCLFLFAWEHPGDRSHAHPTTRWGAGHVVPLAACGMVVTALLAGLEPLVPMQTIPHARAIFFCCGFSSALLLFLHLVRHRLPRTSLRALADVTLLTPLPLLLLRNLSFRHG